MKRLAQHLTVLGHWSDKDQEAAEKEAQEQVRALDQDVPIAHMQSMEQVIADKLWRGRLAMTLLGLFAKGILALSMMARRYSAASEEGMRCL